MAGTEVFDERCEPLDELAVHLARDEHALHGDADLPCIHVTPARRRRRNPIEVGVGEHDQRAVRTELEREALDPRDPGDLLSDGGRACEADLSHARVDAQHTPELRARPGHALDRVLRKPGLEQRAREEERGERRLARGLQDDRVAGGERGPDLVSHEQRGIVERRDRDDDPARLPDRECELAGAVRRRVDRHRLAVHARAFGGARTKQRGDPRRLAARLRERLADLERDRACELLDVALDRVRRPTKDLAALERRERAHRRRSFDGGCDGALGVGGCCDGHDADDLSVVRVADLLLACRATPLACDVHRHASTDVVCGRDRTRREWCV